MVDEGVRLYSRMPRVPVDVIAPQHIEIHADLERWGAWNRDRYQPATCASIEKMYEKGGRDATPASTAPSIVNPRHMQIERAVRYMGMRLPQHGETVKLFYVNRRTPQVICRLVVIHWRDFPVWIGTCRSMVVNIIKTLD